MNHACFSIITIIFVLISGLASPLHAQEVFNLQGCIDYSLSHHQSVEVCQNNVQIAKEQKKQTVSNYLPQASGSFNITDNLKLQTTIIPAGIFGPEEIEMQFGKKYNNNATVDISQTIYDQTKLNSMKSGKTNIEMARYQEKLNAEQLIYNTAQAYFQVLIYKEYESKLLGNVLTYAQLTKILELQLKKGVAIETDLERIKVSLKSTEYQLFEISTQRKNALNNLKYAMGLPLDAEISIADSLDYEKYATVPYVDAFAVDSLSDYAVNKTNVDLQKINYQNKKALFLPSVNSFARLGSQAYDDSFSHSFDKWNDFYYVGVSLNVPIFSSLRRSSQVKESRLVYSNARSNLELLEKNYQLRFQNSEKSLLTAHNSYLSNKDNLELAQKILNKTKLNYQEGAVPLSDFLNDDTASKNANTNYITSLFSYMIARLDYEKAKGTLFSFYNQLKNN